jgi:hypothetical protein
VTADKQLRARRRAEQIRASRAKKTPDRRASRAKRVKKRWSADRARQIQTKVTQEDILSKKKSDAEPEDKSLVHVL